MSSYGVDFDGSEIASPVLEVRVQGCIHAFSSSMH